MQNSQAGLEANFDGLVGPTHNYAGLSLGNVASLKHAQLCSNPKAAAQQGLAKMKALYDLGLLQGVLAPHERPDIYTLRQLGFTGTNEQILAKAYKNSPEILASCYSASSMWSANAATVSSSLETADKKVHFTPANLVNKFHRSIEVSTTAAILKAVFADSQYFHHHAPLPSHEYFGDEGAANHTRLAKNYDSAGIELYIFGKYAFNSTCQQPKKYPARQTYEASRAIVNLHGLKDDKVIYIQQHPDVIDQGVFHNDVIAVGNNNVLFYHQAAFYNSNKVIEEIKRKFQGDELYLIEVKPDEVSVQDCIATYLFNTQIITLAHGDMCIIAPEHCKENVQVKSYLDYLLTKNTPIKSVQYFDVNESMKNGGGPACLRLRVVLNKHEQQAVNQHCLLSDRLYFDLLQWIEKHYRDKLTVDDFRDVNLLHECRTALDELTQLLHLGSVYKFQQI